MILVSFSTDKEKGTITLALSGHANSAEEGHDIVCASASILAYTVAQIAKNMEVAGLLASPPTISMEKGDAEITVRPINNIAYTQALSYFHVARVGYELLAHNHPQYVELFTFAGTEIQS